MWQLRDIPCISFPWLEAQEAYIFLWTSLSDQPGIRRGLLPCLEDHEEPDGKQHHGRSSQAREMNGNKYISNHMWEKLSLPSASLQALINTGKAFWSDIFMGSKFFYQYAVIKNAVGGRHGVLISEVFFCWNEFLKQSIQSCATAPHEQDVAECCHSTAWSE